MGERVRYLIQIPISMSQIWLFDSPAPPLSRQHIRPGIHIMTTNHTLPKQELRPPREKVICAGVWDVVTIKLHSFGAWGIKRWVEAVWTDAKPGHLTFQGGRCLLHQMFSTQRRSLGWTCGEYVSGWGRRGLESETWKGDQSWRGWRFFWWVWCGMCFEGLALPLVPPFFFDDGGPKGCIVYMKYTTTKKGEVIHNTIKIDCKFNN